MGCISTKSSLLSWIEETIHPTLWLLEFLSLPAKMMTLTSKVQKLWYSTAETSLNFVLLPPSGILRHKILNLKLSLRSGRNI